MTEEEQEAINLLNVFKLSFKESKPYKVTYTLANGNEYTSTEIENIFETVLNLISKLQKENKKQSKVIDETTKEIENMTGSCPLDRFDFNDIDCENKCNTGIEAECWKQYFYRKVEEDEKC